MITLNDPSLNMIVVGDITKANWMAERFQLECFNNYMEAVDTPKTEEALLKHNALIDQGLMLRDYQRLQVDTFTMLSTMYDDDDFVEDLKNGKACDWLIDMQDLVTDFKRINPSFQVHSVVPVDLQGTVAFIGRNNMTPTI